MPLFVPQQASLTATTICFYFIFGACFGSFLNVVVYRLPANLSLLYPPSHCPNCKHRLGIHDNIPVLGWLFLAGKCRYCNVKISPRYPAVEGLMGLLGIAVASQFGLSTEAIAAFVLLFWLVALALIDLDTFTLPEALTRSGLVLGLTFRVFLGWQAGALKGAITQLFMGIFAAVLALWLLDIVRILGSLLLNKEAMGGGDPKLLAMIGAWLGWQHVLLTLFAASALGTLIMSGAMGLGKHKRDQPLPFGPFLSVGAMASLFWGDRLMNWYLNMLAI